MNRVIIQVIILFLIIYSNLFALSIEPKEAMKYIGDKNVRFISSDNTQAYIKEHIMGAISIYLHNIELKDNKDIEEYLSLKGITNTQLLIIYSNISISNTYLLEDFFNNIGHKRVVVLNDGCHGIKLLDPNQKIYNELKSKRKKYEILLTLTKDEDELKKHKEKIKSIDAKMDIIKPKFLILQGIEHKYPPSEYIIDNNIDSKIQP